MRIGPVESSGHKVYFRIPSLDNSGILKLINYIKLFKKHKNAWEDLTNSSKHVQKKFKFKGFKSVL